MNLRTRRGFLGIPESQAQPIAASQTELETQQTKYVPTAYSTIGNLKVWVTDEHRRISPAPAIEWADVQTGRTVDDAIALIPEKRHQPILGFGGALSDATCYMFNDLSPAARADLFQTLFHHQKWV